jgi:hypothetical protein
VFTPHVITGEYDGAERRLQLHAAAQDRIHVCGREILRRSAGRQQNPIGGGEKPFPPRRRRLSGGGRALPPGAAYDVYSPCPASREPIPLPLWLFPLYSWRTI